MKQDTISHETYKEIYQKFQEIGCSMAFNTGFTYLFIEKMREEFHAVAKTVDTMEALKSYSISSISMEFADTDIERVQEYADMINEIYTDVTAFRNTNSIDVIPKGNSKGIAVSAVAKEFHVALEDVYTIGDSWNDVSMFEITDNAYTFTYAEKELQAQANYVVDSVHECVSDMLSAIKL